MKEATKAAVLRVVVAEPIPEEGRMRLLEPAAEQAVLAMGMALAREPDKA